MPNPLCFCHLQCTPPVPSSTFVTPRFFFGSSPEAFVSYLDCSLLLLPWFSLELRTSRASCSCVVFILDSIDWRLWFVSQGVIFGLSSFIKQFFFSLPSFFVFTSLVMLAGQETFSFSVLYNIPKSPPFLHKVRPRTSLLSFQSVFPSGHSFRIFPGSTLLFVEMLARLFLCEDRLGCLPFSPNKTQPPGQSLFDPLASYKMPPRCISCVIPRLWRFSLSLKIPPLARVELVSSSFFVRSFRRHAFPGGGLCDIPPRSGFQTLLSLSPLLRRV